MQPPHSLTQTCNTLGLVRPSLTKWQIVHKINRHTSTDFPNGSKLITAVSVSKLIITKPIDKINIHAVVGLSPQLLCPCIDFLIFELVLHTPFWCSSRHDSLCSPAISNSVPFGDHGDSNWAIYIILWEKATVSIEEWKRTVLYSNTVYTVMEKGRWNLMHQWRMVQTVCVKTFHPCNEYSLT